MNIAHSGYGGLTIIQIDDEMRIIDNDLNVYDTFCVDNPFLDPMEIIKSFVRHTLEYYKNCEWKQFMTLELRLFAKSDFVKETLEYVREN